MKKIVIIGILLIFAYNYYSLLQENKHQSKIISALVTDVYNLDYQFKMCQTLHVNR